MTPALSGTPVVEKTGRTHCRLQSATPARGREYPTDGTLRQGAFLRLHSAPHSRARPRVSGFRLSRLPGNRSARGISPVKLFWLVSILLLGAGSGSAVRAPAVRFRTVETTYRAETSRPQKTIDGVDANPDQGWSVAPEVAKPQAAVFTARQAVVAERLRISLCFLSGVYNAHFREFVISGTSAPNPSLHGHWEPLAPWQVYSTGTKLAVLEGSRMRSSGDAFNTVFVVEILGFPRRLTGLRVDVLTADQAQRHQPEVGGREQGDFTLTQFRVEAFDAETTNVALGRPAKASHKNWGGISPGVSHGRVGGHVHSSPGAEPWGGVPFRDRFRQGAQLGPSRPPKPGRQHGSGAVVDDHTQALRKRDRKRESPGLGGTQSRRWFLFRPGRGPSGSGRARQGQFSRALPSDLQRQPRWILAAARRGGGLRIPGTRVGCARGRMGFSWGLRLKPGRPREPVGWLFH